MSLAQLAQLSGKDKERLEKTIPGFNNKYERHDWKKQALVSSES
jgi:predicted flap endonuclease-1-like 5' DNA nuclease